MLSANAAIRVAQANNYQVERLIGLDSASMLCREYFEANRPREWRICDLDCRDLGAARNALASEARGRWIAFLDADDLFSENWLVQGARRMSQAEQKNERVILHPEANFFFDAAASVLVNAPQCDPLFTPYYWYSANYYDSLVMAPRRAFIETPYQRREPQFGFGYEDWRWNLDTMSSGWRHEPVRDTIIFKRRQDASLLSDLNQARSLLWTLDSLAIDRMV